MRDMPIAAPYDCCTCADMCPIPKSLIAINQPMPSAPAVQVMQDIAARSRGSNAGGARRSDWVDDVDEKVMATGQQRVAVACAGCQSQTTGH